MRFAFFILLLVSLMLGGCARQHGIAKEQQTYVSQQVKLQQQRATIANALTGAGATVYLIGDDINIIIPANTVFVGQSANLYRNASTIFNQVVALANCYPNVMIKIAAYTYSSDNALRDQVLTQEWAQIAARNLWQRGINTRLLYAVGHGACDNVSKRSKAINSRLEIKFRVTERDEEQA